MFPFDCVFHVIRNALVALVSVGEKFNFDSLLVPPEGDDLIDEDGRQYVKRFVPTVAAPLHDEYDCCRLTCYLLTLVFVRNGCAFFFGAALVCTKRIISASACA